MGVSSTYEYVIFGEIICNRLSTLPFFWHSVQFLNSEIQNFITEFFETPGNESAKVPLERWYEVAENANWKNFADMKDDFGSVDSVGNQHYVFNLSGNNFRLVVVVKFVMGYVFVRWVGRHKDYDKIDCKNI